MITLKTHLVAVKVVSPLPCRDYEAEKLAFMCWPSLLDGRKLTAQKRNNNTSLTLLLHEDGTDRAQRSICLHDEVFVHVG